MTPPPSTTFRSSVLAHARRLGYTHDSGGGVPWCWRGLAPRHVSQVSGQGRCAVWWHSRPTSQVIARLLASKMEQSQKVLRTMAAGVTPRMQDSSF